MRKSVQKNWTVFWAGFCLAFAVVLVAYAAPTRLVAFTSLALKDDAGNILADGSIVQIIGSSNNIIGDGAPGVGSNNFSTIGGTNMIYDSTLDDDVIIGTIEIDSTFSNGTFFTSDFVFESDDIKYVYIRFFDYTNEPVIGFTNWGLSPIFPATNINFSTVIVDFGGDYQTTNQNNFTIIPEPSTANLILLFAALLFGMRSCMKRPALAEAKSGDGS